MNLTIGKEVKIFSVKSDIYTEDMKNTLNLIGRIDNISDYNGEKMYLVGNWWYRELNLKPSKLRLG